GFLSGAQAAIGRAGVDPADLDDTQVRAFDAAAREMLPPEIAALTDALVGAGEVPTTGLILVFQDTAGLDEAQALDQQRELAAVVSAAPVPDGVDVSPFAFGLLLSDGDIGPEVGRLFGTALVIILLVLAVVYWLRPSGTTRRRIARRTAADVGITFAVIVLSVVWMQGIGVLLGPGYAGFIGGFSPQTQIVPILIVGLGVDFAIHLLARHRHELALATGGPGDVDAATHRSLAAVGPTLALCTAATAIGFLTNLASPVDFLATLGVLAAVGITAAFVLTLTIVPAVRVMLDRRGARRATLPVESLGTTSERALPRMIGRTAVLAERAPVATVVVAVLMVVVGGYGFSQLDAEFELTDFVPRDEPGLETLALIQRDFEGGFEETTEILLRGDLDAARADGTLDTAVARLAEVDDVAVLGDRADAQVDVTGDGTLGRVRLRTTAGQGGAAPLASALHAAFAPLRDAGVETVVTSPQIVQATIGEDIEDSQIRSLAIALAAAMALLAIHHGVSSRRPLLGVITVLPVVLVLAATFGTMAVTGIPLNPVTATLAALSIGIGVPFTIHVTERFLEERAEGDGQGAIRRTVTRTGGALAGSALTTAIGFGVLVTSTLRPFEQLGYVIVYAIGWSLVA
ncbi:MAG: MMPL family transporter, partial [Nitriliruptoraceae bacterium]